MKALKTASTKNQMPYVFTDIKYANLYHDALRKEKQFSMPSSAVVCFCCLAYVNKVFVIPSKDLLYYSGLILIPYLQVIFKGINRDKCENMLEKMRYV